MPRPPTATLKPYLAPLLLERAGAQTPAALLNALQAEVEATVTKPSAVVRTVLGASRALTFNGLRVKTIEYSEEKAPPWAPQSAYRDLSHHLVVIAVKGAHAAICASDPGLRSRLGKDLAAARPISRNTVEQAFVGDRARVMWLSGIHAPTDAKPNAKTLMGSALEYSLDPLGDQSFYYTAVRSTVPVPLAGAPSPSALVGAAPDAGRIWINQPANWTNFVADLEAVLDIVATPPQAVVRFRALARAVSSGTGVADPYEIAFAPPELLSDDEVDPDLRELAIRWAYDCEFEITATNGLSMTAAVRLAGVRIGNVELQVGFTGDRVDISSRWVDEPAGQEAARTECNTVLSNAHWLKIYYDTGHTVSAGKCFLGSYQDQRFTWRFEPFAGYDVKAEKPAIIAGSSLAACIGTPKANGDPDDSLFAYILEVMFPQGWLASDDGSMEFADFVHIDDATDMVTLVHAKASKSASADRQISVPRYEVVVGQAVKNLRHLSATTLHAELIRGQTGKIGGAVWRDGARQANRTGIIARAGQLGPNHPRRVIVLQPQLTQREHDLCRSGQAPHNRILRMHQIDTLMLSADLSARAVGGSLIGWSAA